MTEVTTAHGRKIIVLPGWQGKGSRFLGVERTAYPNKKEQAILSGDEVREVAAALLGNNVAVITDLPEAAIDSWDLRVYAGNADRPAYSDPAKIEETAKSLLAIAKFIRKANAEKEAAEAKRVAEAEAAIKAEKDREDKLAERRDALAQGFAGSAEAGYQWCSNLSKAAIDRVIELENAAAKKTTTAASVFGL